MNRMLLGMGVLALSALGAPGLGVSEAVAQVPGESVVYETVAPGTRTVNYGERVKVRRGLFGKTVIKERPVRYVTTTPPVVRETRVIRPAPIIEQQVVQPAPVIESRGGQAPAPGDPDPPGSARAGPAKGRGPLEPGDPDPLLRPVSVVLSDRPVRPTWPGECLMINDRWTNRKDRSENRSHSDPGAFPSDPIEHRSYFIRRPIMIGTSTPPPGVGK